MTKFIPLGGPQNTTSFIDNTFVEFLAALKVAGSPRASTPLTGHALEASILQQSLPETVAAAGLQQVWMAYKAVPLELQLKLMQAIAPRIDPSQEPQYLKYVASLQQRVAAQNT